MTPSDPEFFFFDRKADTARTESTYLPHWYQYGVIYFVTFRLADSMPREKLDAWEQERLAWLKAHPEPRDDRLKSEYFKLFPKRLQEWLDAGHGSMLLKRADAREVVDASLRHFDGDRYVLDEFVVAANHVHVLVAPKDGHQLPEILGSWKSYSAKAILKLENVAGIFENSRVWQRESWDHIVRSERSLERFREYIRAHSRPQ